MWSSLYCQNVCGLNVILLVDVGLTSVIICPLSPSYVAGTVLQSAAAKV